jgi:hypothetical protein
MSKGFPIVIIICLFTFFLTDSVGRAATESPKAAPGAAAPLAKDELQALLKPYVNLKSLKTEFVQKKHLADLKLSLTSTGRLEVEKPHRVVWTVLTPSFLEVRIAEKDLTMTTMKDGQKQEQKISFDQMGSEQGAKGLALLVPWLEMDVEKLLAQYSIVKTGPSQLRFTPRDSTLFKTIEMTLASNGHMRTLTFSEQNGDSIRIDFKAAKIENIR